MIVIPDSKAGIFPLSWQYLQKQDTADDFNRPQKGQTDRKVPVARLMPEQHHTDCASDAAETERNGEQRSLRNAELARTRTALVRPHRPKADQTHDQPE